jgi:hypothetical protein
MLAELGKRRGETRRRFFISRGRGGMKGRQFAMNPKHQSNTDTPVDMLAEVQSLYRRSAEELVVAINTLHSKEIPDGKATEQIMRELRAAFGWAFSESEKLEKLSKSLTAGGGGYDLDAARIEIGGRLARLRAARSDQ